MRLFAAVLPPDDVIGELAAEVARLKKLPGSGGLRWTGRPGWHFTLAFYGEVDDDVVPDLSARLERAAHRSAPFALALSGGGQFGHGSVLWAGAEGDLTALGHLADRAEAAARKAGVPMGEHRRYKAHLTVARSRGRWTYGRTSRPCTASPAAPGRWRTWRWCAATCRVPGRQESSRGTRRSPAGLSKAPVRLGRVDPKTRNRIMAGALVLMFVVVALAAALGK